MSRRAWAALSQRVEAHDPESRVLGWGRSIVALAQASVLVWTPSAYLFVPVGDHDGQPVCEGWARASAFCMGGGEHLQLVSWILVGLLVVVASGLLPRYLSVVHFWVAISMNQALSLPDGGEAAAQALTLFLVVASSNDRRLFHWQRGAAPLRDSLWQGVSWAGSWAVRLQVAYIYLNSSLAKLAVEPWQDGSATYYVSRMESFGAAGVADDLIRAATAVPVVALATAWGAMALEFAIAWFVLAGGRRHALALAICVVLHLGILVQLGIVSFAMIMVGAVTCGASSGLEGWRRDAPAEAGPAVHDLPRRRDGDDVDGVADAPATSPTVAPESRAPARS